MSQKEKKLSFEVVKKDKDGKETTLQLAIVSPSWEEQLEAQDKYNATFKRSSNGALLRPKLDDFLKEQGVWTTEKEAELTQLQKELEGLLETAYKGRMKVFSELVPVVKEIKKVRHAINRLTSKRDQYYSNTAEGQAENMRFACLIAASVVYDNNGKRYWPTVDDYLAESGGDVASVAVEKYTLALMGGVESFGEDLPENKLLIRLGAMDKKCRFLRESDKKSYQIIQVNKEWKDFLVDDEGRFVNEAGEFIDVNNRRVDADGNYLVEDDVWFAEDGTALVSEKKEEEAPAEPESVEKTE